MTEAERRFNSLDWRGQLEWAIAYRIVEMQGIDPETARLLVRDFTKRGITGAKDPATVSQAIVSLFTPILQSIVPLLPQITSGIMTVVETQNQRGLSAEQHAETALNPEEA